MGALRNRILRYIGAAASPFLFALGANQCLSGHDPVDVDLSFLQESTLELTIEQELRGDTAVFLIDMQKEFVGDLKYEEVHELIDKQLTVLDYCKEHNIPVFYFEVRDDDEEPGPTIQEIKDKLDELDSVVYIEKDTDSAFLNRNYRKGALADALRGKGIENIVLMGINASVCVRKTGEDALDESFCVLTSADLIADPAWCDERKDYDDGNVYDCRTTQPKSLGVFFEPCTMVLDDYVAVIGYLDIGRISEMYQPGSHDYACQLP